MLGRQNVGKANVDTFALMNEGQKSHITKLKMYVHIYFFLPHMDSLVQLCLWGSGTVPVAKSMQQMYVG
jgi:hypothetical protein